MNPFPLRKLARHILEVSWVNYLSQAELFFNTIFQFGIEYENLVFALL